MVLEWRYTYISDTYSNNYVRHANDSHLNVRRRKQIYQILRLRAFITLQLTVKCYHVCQSKGILTDNFGAVHSSTAYLFV